MIQHAAMHIVCPHCQAVYHLKNVQPYALLLCHRCKTEFALDGEGNPVTETAEIVPEEAAVDDSLPLFDHAASVSKVAAASSAVVQTQADEQPQPVAPSEPLTATNSTLQAPMRKKARIWPWITAVLIGIAGTGFWLNHETWLEHPWLRSQLIRLHLPAKVHDSDWLVLPDSVHAEWLTRKDNSQVLVIQGDVLNQMYCALTPPKIQIHFFAPGRPENAIAEQLVSIAQPPTMEAIRTAPYKKPAEDTLPIPGKTERGFIIVLETLPENLGDFTLTAVVPEK